MERATGVEIIAPASAEAKDKYFKSALAIIGFGTNAAYSRSMATVCDMTRCQDSARRVYISDMIPGYHCPCDNLYDPSWNTSRAECYSINQIDRTQRIGGIQHCVSTSLTPATSRVPCYIHGKKKNLSSVACSKSLHFFMLQWLGFP